MQMKKGLSLFIGWKGWAIDSHETPPANFIGMVGTSPAMVCLIY
jgi:hypothetical protein